MFFGKKLTGDLRKKVIRIGITLILTLVLGVFAIDSCSQKDIDLENLNLQLDSAYTMRTLKVDMLISDSGIVRYRLISPEWLIYDNQHRRQWVFPKGLRLETYDTIQEGRTLIVADSAVQHLNKEEWELLGNVRATGLNGELLCTPHLYWERQEHKLYSDDSTYFLINGDELRGQHFRAKDDLSEYYIYEDSGNIKIEEGTKAGGTSSNVASKRIDSLRTLKDSLQTAVDTIKHS